MVRQDAPIPKQVLVVDDSGVCRTRLKVMCNRLFPGCKTTQAVDGDEAVDLFEKRLRTEEAFDLVLMDLNMVGDDDRPQLTGMLDERNGPQAAARIRRSEVAASHDFGAVPQMRSIVVVITGSTRTDRWDLAYYHGCGIDGFLCKPVSMVSLKTAIDQVQQKSMERKHYDRADMMPGDSPLFGLSSVKQIDMYIDPQLLERANEEALAQPIRALDGLGSSIVGGLSAELDLSLARAQAALMQRPSSREAEGRQIPLPGRSPAAGNSREPGYRDRRSISPVPGEVAGSSFADQSPLPPPKHTQRMAPRMPRRAPAAMPRSQSMSCEGKPAAEETAVDGAAAPKPRALPHAARANGPLHFVLVHAEPLMLMMQTALIQSISLDHVITRAGECDEALERLRGSDRQIPIDVLLLGPVVDAEAKLDPVRTDRMVQTIRRFETERRLLSGNGERVHSFAVIVVTASASVTAEIAQGWQVDAVLKMPLRKMELLQAVSQAIKAKLLAPAPSAATVDDLAMPTTGMRGGR